VLQTIFDLRILLCQVVTCFPISQDQVKHLRTTQNFTYLDSQSSYKTHRPHLDYYQRSCRTKLVRSRWRPLRQLY